ncbi:MAG: M56 family metallopeptidase, partial [Acetatifactor sp.]|nr:M56 family metallopeptidase [Acetatifactor sp.]
MSDILKTFLSMSVSGSLLILGLFLLKPLFQNRLSRQWQYYVWLIVIVRLLLPVTLDVSLVGNMFRQIGHTVTQPAPRSAQNEEIFGGQRFQEDISAGKTEFLQDGNMYGDAESLQDGGDPDKSLFVQGGNSLGNEAVSGKDTVSPILEYLCVLWLGGALVLLVRKITAYQCFVRYIKADCEEVSDILLLDQLAQASDFAGVRRPVELYVNRRASSPMLLGFFRPCIILPVIDLPGDELLCIFRHELIHYKRRDMLYKWLVQITICLHWFNPLVYLMSRELDRACELSCDEAVIRSLDEQGRRAYGDTLLHAVKTCGEYGKSVVSATLGESAELLKERLDAIMKFRKMSKRGCCVALLLSAVLIFGSVVSGAYAAEDDAHVDGIALTKAATQNKSVSLENTLPVSEDASGKTAELETIELKGTIYYLVFNEEQLRAIGTGEYGMDLNYMQQADIQLSEKEWVPIGTWENPFTGSYNGNGYEITGLTMKNPDADVVGMFGIAENAHIYNIILRDYDIIDAGKNVSGRSVAPILPLGMGGTRSYDNFVYPKEAASPAQIFISPEDTLLVSVDASEEIATGDVNGGKSDTLADKYYGINLPQFGAVFATLGEDAQAT